MKLFISIYYKFFIKVIVLLDEYENPLIQAYENKYYEEAIQFYQQWMSSALKDNKKVFIGVISGVLKIGQESIFSMLNDLRHIE